MSLEHRLEPDADLLTLASETLKLLAEPTRLHLMWQLDKKEHNVGELVEATGASRTVVSQHLAKLRLGGLVATRKDGRHVYYRIADGHAGRLVTEALSRADHERSGAPTHD